MLEGQQERGARATNESLMPIAREASHKNSGLRWVGQYSFNVKVCGGKRMELVHGIGQQEEELHTPRYPPLVQPSKLIL